MSHNNQNPKTPNYGMGKKTFNTYFLGFVLCIILTLIPFYSIMHSVANKATLIFILLSSAVIQFFVQVICFLRMNGNTEQGQLNIMSFIFTGVVTVVVIGGSLWIMSNLNYFMMH